MKSTTAWVAVAVAILLVSVAHGEAMGKASVDVADAAQKPVVADVVPTKVDGPVAPVVDIVAATAKVSATTDKIVEKSVDVPAIAVSPVTPKTDETSSTVVAKTATVDATAKAVPALSDIEAAPIRGLQAAGSSKPATGTNTSAAPTVGLPSGVINALQVAAALAVVVGLILIGKVLAKKYVPGAKAGNGKGVIEVLARYPLCKNQALVLVRIGSQIVTLNQGKETSQSVLVISDPSEVAKIMGQIEGQQPQSIQAGFTKLLANARMDLEDPMNDPDRSDFELRSMEPENLDSQLEEMAAAKRQLMELRQQVRSVRDSIPRG